MKNTIVKMSRNLNARAVAFVTFILTAAYLAA